MELVNIILGVSNKCMRHLVYDFFFSFGAEYLVKLVGSYNGYLILLSALCTDVVYLKMKICLCNFFIRCFQHL